MSVPISCRLYSRGDELGILELMKACGQKRTVAEWIWQYQSNPFGRLIGIADCRGLVVGQMAWVPLRMKVGKRIIMGSQAVDLVVHPKFRRQGIFLKIGQFLAKEAEKEGNEVVYGFPNRQAHAGHLKYGWFNVCEVPVLVKPLNFNGSVLSESSHFPQLLKKSKLLVRLMATALQTTLITFSFFSRALSPIRLKSNDSQDDRVRMIESFDSRFDDFWEVVSKDYITVVCRDKEFLNWRYSKRPQAKYVVLVVEGNDRIRGYIVLWTDDRKGLGCVVDILADLNHRDAIRSLLLKAVEYFRNRKIDLVTCWMLKGNSSAKVYYGMLREQGFVPLYWWSNPLIARLNLSNLAQKYIRDPRNWYITMGDSDSV
jgi:GNAT superfamily N-acetyltransferase